MKIGLKIWDEEGYELISPLLDKIDFLEVMAIKENDYSFLKKNKLPIIIHCMHNKWGVNFANAMKFTINRDAIRFAIKLADEYNAKFIIVHPGYKEKGFCAVNNISHFLSNFNDGRILVENHPKSEEEYSEMYGTSLGDLSKILEISEKGFCLDFEHAGTTAKNKHEPVMEFIKDLMVLEPAYFHICNCKYNSSKENPLKNRKDHIALSKGDLPIKEIKKLIPKDAWVLLETEHNIKEHEKDIEFLRK